MDSDTLLISASEPAGSYKPRLWEPKQVLPVNCKFEGLQSGIAEREREQNSMHCGMVKGQFCSLFLSTDDVFLY